MDIVQQLLAYKFKSSFMPIQPSASPPTVWQPQEEWQRKPESLDSHHHLFEQLFRDEFLKCSLKEITIIRRIGSESQNAVVFKASFSRDPTIQFALKCIPVVDSKSVAKIGNEIEIARTMSNAVRNRETEHFLLLTSIACNKFYTAHLRDVDAPILEEGRRWFCISQIVKDMSRSQRIRFEQRAKQLTTADLCGESNYISIYMMLIASELCWGDLKQFGEIVPDDVDVWKSIILQVLTGITHMQKYGIVHGDLHLANVLLRCQQPRDGDMCPKEELPGNVTCLIHDFGESYYGNDLFFDAEKFLYSIERSPTLGSNVKRLASWLGSHLPTHHADTPKVNSVAELAKMLS